MMIDDSFFETTAVEVFVSPQVEIWASGSTGHSFSAFFPFRLYIALTLRHILSVLISNDILQKSILIFLAV